MQQADLLPRTIAMPISRSRSCAWLIAIAGIGLSSRAGAEDHATFFENRIRPVLVEHCYKCHSLEAGKDKGGLRVDSREAMVHGGASGPAVVPGKPDASLLLRAIRQVDPDTAMPPKGEPLTAAVVKDFESWINHGAVFPAALAAAKQDLRDHWAYKPVTTATVPRPTDGQWPRHDVDRFVRVAQETAGVVPGPDADTVTLARRLSVVLTGLPPTPEDIARVAQGGSTAVTAEVDRLLATSAFGERWARHWMDLVRYAEGTGNEYDYEYPGTWRYRDYLVRAFNADLPYDRLVREHVAGDLLPPRLDPASGANEARLATVWWNLGEAASAPVDLANDEAERLDNRIDTFGKVFNALTLGCARCHDHKFDPVSMREYYGLYGILAASPLDRAWSNEHAFTKAAEALRPLRQQVRRDAGERAAVSVQPLDADGATVLGDFASGLPDGWRANGQVEPVDGALAAYLGRAPGVWSGTLSTRLPAQVRSPTFTIAHDHLDVLASGDHATIQVVVANYEVIRDPIYNGLKQRITGGDGTWRWHRFDIGRWKGRRAHVEVFTGTVHEKYQLFATEDHAEARFGLRAVHLRDGGLPEVPPGADASGLVAAKPDAALAARIAAIEENIPAPQRFLGVADQDGTDVPLHTRGDATKPRSDHAPRGYLAVCGDLPAVSHGSGRRELAESLLAPANPLTARVIVNRVWHHLFGRGLVPTVDNFGRLGEAPSHPELLDWLATRFVDTHRWRLKPLIRELVLTRTWQLASGPAPEGDADNRLLTRSPLRRLDAEALRDAILAVAGTLDRTIGGPSIAVPHRLGEAGTGSATEYAPASGPLDGARRRSLYLAVRRNYPNTFLALFDQPASTGPFGRRNVSNVPAQALALLNDPFVAEQAAAWATRISTRDGDDEARVTRMLQEAFARRPTPEEIAAARALATENDHGWRDLALALLNAKEFLYVR